MTALRRCVSKFVPTWGLPHSHCVLFGNVKGWQEMPDNNSASLAPYALDLRKHGKNIRPALQLSCCFKAHATQTLTYMYLWPQCDTSLKPGHFSSPAQLRGSICATHMYAADTHLDAEKIPKKHSNPSPSKLRHRRLHQSESCTGRAVSWNWCWRWSSHWWIGNGIYGGIPYRRLLA